MKQRYKSIALIGTLIVVLLSQFAVPQRVYAATFTVTKTTDTNDGACDADCSLREAIVAANATAGADIVTLTSGSTYILSIAGAGENASATGDLDVTDAAGVTINTSGAGTATIDANDIDRILDVRPGGALTLTNITITDGSASTNGGGLFVDGSTTITGGAFTANAATAGSDGGAIYVNSGTVSISGTTFDSNSSTDDGGAMYLIGGTTTITGATFSGNTGSDIAGAIRIDADNTSISNTTFSNNTSNSINTLPGVGGGGIFINETADTTTITLSTFNGNTTSRATSARGGAIYNEGTNVVVANSTFTGNTAAETVAGAAGDVAQGGAVFQDDTGPDPSLTLYNVTFSGNSTTVTGAGTASGGTIYKNTATGTITLANTLVANGTAGGAANNCSGSAITDGGNNIDFNGGGCGIANSANPNFGALTGSPAYFPLNLGSPAIDTGSNAVCANAFVNNQSQNGLTRPQPAAGTCDIGSFERIGDTTAPTLLSFTRQNPATSPTNADTLVFRATFDEDVTNVSTGDFSVNGGTTATATGVATVSASVYDITVSGGDLAGFNGTVGLDLAGGQNITDLSSNALPTTEPATDETYVVDNTAPVVSIGAPSVTSTTSGPVDFAITITGATTINLTAGDVTLNTTGTATGTVSVTNGTTANPTVTISGITGDGTIGISIAAGVAVDAATNSSAAAGPSATFTVDNSAPTVTMTSAAPDPTNTSPIPVTVQFSEAVTGFTALDITPGNGTVGNFVAVDADTYTFDLTPTAQGLVTADIAGGVAFDAVNNGNTAALQFSRTYDTSGPVVTIGAPSVASTTTGPVDFPITITGSTSQNLLPADVTLNTTGTATGTVSVTNGATANPTVTISAITGSGTIGISIAAGVATDGLNTSPGAGPSATFNVDNGGPVVTASVPANGSSVTGPTQLTVTYNEDVQNLGAGGAANTANYLLVEAGVNTAFDTVSCLLGVAPDDVTIAIDGAAYANGGGAGPFVATIDINGGVALPVGSYRLYVCGTTSVQDLLGNELNNGAADTIIEFTVVVAPGGGAGGGNARASAIPTTGFPQGELTSLPLQSAEKAYSATTMWLEIPSLSVKMKIVGVPQTKDGWDVTWLNRDAGWLNGSAFPTWSGNSVITGHVWDAFNKPGPFTNLKDLKYGDQVKIHAFGQVFIYEVRESSLISPSNVTTMLRHEEKSWLTLVTCDTYNETTKAYKYRRIVRAVLISVTAEK